MNNRGFLTELFKANRSSFVEDSKSPIKLDARLFSANAANVFVSHATSSRSLMSQSHLAQAVNLDKPDLNIIQSGLDQEFAKYTASKTITVNSEFLTLIKKYHTLTLDKLTGYVLIYRELTTSRICAMELPIYDKLSPYFGYEFTYHKDLTSFVTGDYLKAGTIIAKSPSVIVNDAGEQDDSALGLNANLVNITLPETDEDGYIVSKSFAKRLSFKVYDTRTISVGRDSFLLNLYGDENNFKPFPDIGEPINEDGALVASRRYDKRFGPALYSTKEYREFNPVFDNAVYVRGHLHSKVIDIKIIKNNIVKEDLPIGTDELCELYSKGYVTYCEKLIQSYDAFANETRGKTGNEIVINNTFNTLLVEAYGITDSNTDLTKLKLTARKELLDKYSIEFTIEYNYPASLGYKLSDTYHGGKGVITAIWEDEDMPTDEFGVRADVIGDPRSTISRLNVSRLMEKYIKSGTRRAQTILRDRFKLINKPTLQDCTSNEIVELFGIVLEFASLVNSDQFKTYNAVAKSMNLETMILIIDDILTNEFYIFMTIDMEAKAYEIIDAIDRSRFKPTKGFVTFNYRGRPVVTKEKISIGPLYFILLSKIADDALACSSAKINHFSIPVVASKADKYRTPYRNSAVRVNGETEGRLFAAYAGREFLAEFKDRATSVKSHAILYEKLLDAPEPGNIKNCIDRTEQPYGTDKALLLLNSVWNSAGIELAHSLSNDSDDVTNLTKDSIRMEDLDGIESLDIDYDNKEEN